MKTLQSAMESHKVCPSVRELAADSKEYRRRSATHASLWGSGIEASTALISDAPKPVAVLFNFGLGVTGPWKSYSGALVDGLRSLAEMEGLRSLAGGASSTVAIVGRFDAMLRNTQ
jgi:hypothetical protein